MGKLAALIALMIVAGNARADDAPNVTELEARGEALAKQNDYTQAIDAFKQADVLQTRAAHACMIGLAYMRRELWPQAELFLALCEKRATPGDQPPAWIDEAEHQLAQKLSAAQIPAVTIVVTPPTAEARLTVSSFAPDENFPPQTIHLPPGTHLVEVTAPGYVPQRREVEIHPAQPITMDFKLVPVEMPHTAPPARPSAPSKPLGYLVPWILGGAGIVLAGVGALYDVEELGPARDHLATAPNSAVYNAFTNDFDTKRDVTVGLFAGAALTIGLAAVLHYTVFDHAPSVTASIDDHRGLVAVTWHR